MSSKLSRIVTLASTFSRHVCQLQNMEKLESVQNEIIKEMLTVTSKDLNFNFTSIFSHSRAPIMYVPICQSSTFSIGIFALKRGSVIPLHDHPNMYGIFKLIHGSLTLSSMSIHESYCENSQRLVSVKCEEPLTLDVNSKPHSLSPIDGNIHKLIAGKSGAAFLDILTPPYDDNRSCRFYEIANSKQSVNNSSRHDNLSLLKEVPCPSDYWCDIA